MTHSQERRRDPRTVISVMSDVLVPSGRSGNLKYLASAIIVDISHSGLALLMDLPPSGYNALYINNYYFEVKTEIRNITRVNDAGFRVGVEFTSELLWKPQCTKLR
jgi:hypothetical protein